MRRTFITTELLTAALALPAGAGAGAGAGSSITIRLGDGIAVKKSHILCAVQVSHTLVPGQKLVACYFIGRKGTLRQVGLDTAVLVKGTAITCAVSTQKFGGEPARTVACFKVNPQKKP